jgi:hypothetical protein
MSENLRLMVIEGGVVGSSAMSSFGPQAAPWHHTLAHAAEGGAGNRRRGSGTEPRDLGACGALLARLLLTLPWTRRVGDLVADGEIGLARSSVLKDHGNAIAANVAILAR